MKRLYRKPVIKTHIINISGLLAASGDFASPSISGYQSDDNDYIGGDVTPSGSFEIGYLPD